ncbi:MAG: HD-GYP domain-containing protein [Eggerthellaceae bacterium]|nr:HD-GYP domain-containing protein [Eggerthellaceae bacterium]
MSGEPENNDQSASANVKVHITRIGKAIQVVCAVVRVLAVVLVVLSLAGIAMLYAGIGFGDTLSTLAGNSTFVQIVDATIDEETIPARELGMINLFAFTLSQLVFLAFISVLSGLTRDITENEKPFRVETAKQLRRNTFWLVLLIFWNFLAGIIILLIALLLSYLIEYGAYLQEKADETTRIQEQVIVSLAEITENKSGQTGQHVRRVAEYTRILADELGYPEEQIDNIRLASTMHDIGKLLVPTEILEKPGRLTDEEYATIKQHTTDGGRLLENVDGDVMHLSRTIALDHHERWDGNGYAQEKAGEDISFEGRIVAVADVYDALTSRRSYKEAWDDRDAYNEIVRCSGTQFDPQVVEAFKRRYDDINAVRLQLADPAA